MWLDGLIDWLIDWLWVGNGLQVGTPESGDDILRPSTRTTKRTPLLRIAKLHRGCRYPATAVSRRQSASPEELKLVAVFEFDVPVTNLEYIYLMEIDADDDATALNCSECTNNMDESEPTTEEDAEVGAQWKCEWFPLDAIPYGRMPADDVLWYPAVLAGKLLTGKFKFAGEPKYTIKEYSINEVKALDDFWSVFFSEKTNCRGFKHTS